MTMEGQTQGQVGSEAGADDEELIVPLTSEDAEALGDVVEVVAPEPEKPSFREEDKKALERAITAKDKEIQRLKAQAGDLTGLREEMVTAREERQLMFDYLESLQQGTLEELPSGETPFQQRRRELTEQAKGRPTPEQRQSHTEATEFMKAVNEAGLNPYGKEFRDYFGKLSGPTEALEKLPEFVQQQQESSSSAIKAAVEEATAPLRTELDDYKTRLGLKTVETGKPSAPGGARSLAALNEALRKGEIPFDEFREQSKELRKQGG